MAAPKNAPLVWRKLAVPPDISAVYPDFIREMKVCDEKCKGFVPEIFGDRKNHHEPDIFLPWFYDFFYVTDAFRVEFVKPA